MFAESALRKEEEGKGGNSGGEKRSNGVQNVFAVAKFVIEAGTTCKKVAKKEKGKKKAPMPGSVPRHGFSCRWGQHSLKGSSLADRAPADNEGEGEKIVEKVPTYGNKGTNGVKTLRE